MGLALAGRLAGLGVEVRAVSRRRPVALADGVDWRATDAADLDAAADAAKGASAVYQCLNAPYARWPDLFPPLQRGALAAAERAGALLVTLENVYAYGPTGGKPMTEDLSLAATTSEGRTRAAMTTELLTATAADRVRIAGHPVAVRNVPALVLWAMGLVSPLMRGLAEMARARATVEGRGR